MASDLLYLVKVTQAYTEEASFLQVSIPLFAMEARAHFYREEINNTTWEVPEKYSRLKQIGTGAYGSVW